jgi:hypothetical protein
MFGAVQVRNPNGDTSNFDRVAVANMRYHAEELAGGQAVDTGEAL